MKTFTTLLLVMLYATSATAGGLRGGGNNAAIANAASTDRSNCFSLRKKHCKKRSDCAWWGVQGTCNPKKGGARPTPAPTPPAARCQHDHTTPLDGHEAPFAWKTHANGSRNAQSLFKQRIAPSCCAESATEATTLSWPDFMATVDPWCAENKPLTVPCGTKVLVDGAELGGAPIALKGLYVEGELEFVDSGVGVELRSEFVFNCGTIRAGTLTERFEGALDIVLTGQTELWWRGSSFGKTGFVTHGGETFLRSASCDKTTWTRLAATAPRGATRLTVQLGEEDDGGIEAETAWAVGDKLLVTSSSFFPKDRAGVQSEVAEIAAIGPDGRTVTLAAGLKHAHLGCEASDPMCVMASEVAPLSRNIVVRGEAACTATQKCGHFMMSHTNHGTVCGVEFTNMGQRITKGKYPLHFHAGWYAPELVVRSNAVHASFNRGMVVHAMRRMTIVDNTVYNTLGHNFMLEDGVEELNTLVHNLAVHPKPVDWRPSVGCCAQAAADTDGENEDEEGENEDATNKKPSCAGVTKDTCGNRSDGVPNAFWIPNPRNAFIDNTGVAELGKAFRIETRSVIGDTVLWFSREAKNTGRGGKIKNVVPMGFWADGDYYGYAGNVAHSSKSGFMNYPMLRPRGEARYDGYVAWRNFAAITVRNSGKALVVNDATLVENHYAVRAHISKSRVRVTRSRIVGSSDKKRFRKNSLPFKMKKTDHVCTTLGSISADEATLSWARDHGGFKRAAALLGDEDAVCKECPKLCKKTSSNKM